MRETPSLVSAISEGHEVCALDVADLEACQQVCRDIDMVFIWLPPPILRPSSIHPCCTPISAGPTTSFGRQKIRDASASSLPAVLKSSLAIQTMSRLILSHLRAP